MLISTTSSHSSNKNERILVIASCVLEKVGDKTTICVQNERNEENTFLSNSRIAFTQSHYFAIFLESCGYSPKKYLQILNVHVRTLFLRLPVIEDHVSVLHTFLSIDFTLKLFSPQILDNHLFLP